MASETNVKINLKTVAQTGDAEKLVAIIKALGKSLKETGGEDAKKLRGNLAPMLKELSKGGVSADRVKGMVGQIAKVQALGSVSALNTKLSQFGTAQARIIQRTVAGIKAAVEGGDLSENTIDTLNESLERFVAEANKLPPAGLKKLGSDIHNTVAYTQELQDVIASISGIDFKVSGGSGSLDELAHKMQVISEATDLDEGVKELEAAVQDLDPANAASLTKELERIREILNGDLDAKGAEELNAALERVSKTASRLGGQDLGKVSAALNRVTTGGTALSGTLTEATGKTKLAAKVADTVFDSLGVRTDGLSETVTELVKKIPGIGTAFAKMGSLAGIAIAAIITGIIKCYEKFVELRHMEDTFKFDKFSQSIRIAEKEIDAQKFKIQEHYKWKRADLEIDRERADAVRDLAKAQREAAKAAELRGIEDAHARDIISRRHDAASAAEDRAKAYEDDRRGIEDLRSKIAEAKKDRKVLISEKILAERNASKAEREMKKWGAEALSDITETERDHALEKQKDYAQIYTEQSWKAFDVQKQKAALDLEIEGLEKRLAEIAKRDKAGKTIGQRIADANYSASEAERQDSEIAERRRTDALRRQRARDEAMFARDAADTEREHRRSVAEPYQDIVTHLKTAEIELKRFSALEADAAKRREDILRRFTASGRAEMTAEEQFAFDSTTSDLSYARQRRYQEQGNIASLKKQLRDRRIDKDFSDYDERREDYEWRRQGRYSRANYAQRLKMDKERYEEGIRQFEAAEARIRAANAGTRVLTPEERRLAERERAEGRRKMTESRESIRSALYEGDSQKAGFISGLMRNGNRLTQMGLGGDVANWDRKTADNTRRLVQQTKEILTAMNARGKYGSLGAVWGV